MTSTQHPRWRPSRAGILNVYQYEDETLHFADGRLLLRGVNGSGKSTAMNMLLPFLLEADTRKIDAAGEQTGVLRSWMLADTDETQRTGYLWIEFAREDADAPGGIRHHTVGCGIRANRSTDRVTPWWFSTPRRPRIDFSLTAQRIPLAIDALRAELGTDAVFTTPADYRAEIARRFFGGADPSGYLALLHQVRNPRVGDRIDADLPRRLLTWGLPALGAAGVADAVRAMTAAGLPMQLSVLALRASPLAVAAGTPVLVVENPRLVEAAAERRLAAAVLCTNGNPTTAPNLAVAQLRACGARLRYHGDFDAPGLAMTGRARDAGCEPFRMSAPDYLAALAEASAAGVELPRDAAAAPTTPWDPALAVAFDKHRAVVHEERVMDGVLSFHVTQT